MEAVVTSETQVRLYRNTRLHNQGNSRLLLEKMCVMDRMTVFDECE